MATWEPQLNGIRLDFRVLGVGGLNGWGIPPVQDFYPEGIKKIAHPFDTSPYPL
jgi:hypothetical protein